MLFDLLEPSDFELISHPSLWLRKEINNLCLLVKRLILLCALLTSITLRVAHVHYNLYPTVDFCVKQLDLLFFCDRFCLLVLPHLLHHELCESSTEQLVEDEKLPVFESFIFDRRLLRLR